MGVRHALATVVERVRDDRHIALADLRSWQFRTRYDNDHEQWRRLEVLLRHCESRTRYYAETFREAGVTPTTHVTPEQFKRLPLLTKDIIRSRFEDLQSTDLANRKWRVNTSGGSTGEPTRHVQDASYDEYVAAIKALFDEWTGYRVGDAQVRLWGSERDLMVGRDRLRHRVGRWVRNERWLNAFRMSPDRMREYVEAIRRVRPRQILAYVDAAVELGKFLEAHGLEVPPPGAIMTSAGTLHPHMREVIERCFRAPVFNRYGSREVGDVACECERHNGLHVCSPTHHVEILKSDGTPTDAGEVGEVVITSLTNFAMPLVRYRIGDLAAWSAAQCECGRGWPILSEVTGRVTELLFTANGSTVSPLTLVHMIGVTSNPGGWIRQFQVVQQRDRSLLVRLVAVVPPDQIRARYETQLGQIEAAIQRAFGGGASVSFEFPSEIQPSPSGKYAYVISHAEP